MRKFKILFLNGLCSFTAAVAYLNVGTNCIGMIYEPDMPESLKK